MIYTLTLNPSLDKEYRVDDLRMNSVLRARSAREDIGGKGFNVSRMLANLERKTCAVGLMGGRNGQALRDGLTELGIQNELVWIKGESRVNTSIVDSMGKHIKINEAGPAVRGVEEEELIRLIISLARPGDWWVLSGGLPGGLEADFYARLIFLIRGKGAYAALDTHGEAMRLGCRSGPNLVKPNAEEGAEITGLPSGKLSELVEIAHTIHDLGARNVVISAGKMGALAFDGQSTWLAEAPVIKENNPTGAGDAMLAGLVFGLDGGKGLSDALALGAACGAAAAGMPGPAMPSRTRVDALINIVEVKELAC